MRRIAAVLIATTLALSSITLGATAAQAEDTPVDAPAIEAPAVETPATETPAAPDLPATESDAPPLSEPPVISVDEAPAAAQAAPALLRASALLAGPIVQVSGAFTKTSDSSAIPFAFATFTQPDGFERVAYSNASGFYSVELEPGDYTVLFSAFGFADQYYDHSLSIASATPLTVADGQPVTLNAELQPESTVTGTVKDVSGTPLPNVRVALYSKNSENYRIAITGPDGIFRFGQLNLGEVALLATPEPGQYQTVWYANGTDLASATPVAVPAPGGTVAVDIVLPLGATLTVSITDPLGDDIGGTVVLSAPGIPHQTRYVDANTPLQGLTPATYTVTPRPSDLFGTIPPQTVTVDISTPGSVHFSATPALVDLSEFQYPVDLISGPLSVTPGGTYTWVVNAYGNTNVYAILYSDAGPVYVGGARSSTSGPVTITLTIPASTPGGNSVLTFSTINTENEITGLQRSSLALTVAKPSVTTQPDTPKPAALASTGSAPAPLGFAALAALLLGGLALASARRRSIER